jgi:hypothetical protein
LAELTPNLDDLFSNWPNFAQNGAQKYNHGNSTRIRPFLNEFWSKLIIILLFYATAKELNAKF